MQARATVTQEKHSTTTPRVTQEFSHGGTATIVDNRPATVYQRKLQEAMTLQRSTTLPPRQARTPQGSARFQQIATAMGSNYGVDTSGLVATHNSSFPGALNADATIHGNRIHFAPGRDTDSNIKHEVAHAIDNALHGTPMGDTVVKGQRVDTTREKIVDRMAQRTLETPPARPGGSLIQTMGQGGAASAEALSRDAKFRWSQGGDTHEAPFPTTPLTKPQWTTLDPAFRTSSIRPHRRPNRSPTVLRLDFGRRGPTQRNDQPEFRDNAPRDVDDLIKLVGKDRAFADPTYPRPDDVPPHSGYRSFYHQVLATLLDMLPSGQDTNSDQEGQRGELYKILAELKNGAAVAAKLYKRGRRSLGAPKQERNSQYKSMLDGMINRLRSRLPSGVDLIPYAPASEGPEKGKEESKTVETVFKEVWRKRFENARDAVDTALTSAWPTEEDKLKRHMFVKRPEVRPMLERFPTLTKFSRADRLWGYLRWKFPRWLSGGDWWRDLVSADKMTLKYGGSLARGWKGPPKQAVVMTPFGFDVDANLASNTIAMRLLSIGARVDRGQIRPTEAEKRDVMLDDAEDALDRAVMEKLGKTLTVPSPFPTKHSRDEATKARARESEDARRGSTYLTEPFEVFVNIDPTAIREEYLGEARRAEFEQIVRDRFVDFVLAGNEEERLDFKIVATMAFGGGNRGPLGTGEDLPRRREIEQVDSDRSSSAAAPAPAHYSEILSEDEINSLIPLFGEALEGVIHPPTVDDMAFAIMSGPLSSEEYKLMAIIVTGLAQIREKRRARDAPSLGMPCRRS